MAFGHPTAADAAHLAIRVRTTIAPEGESASRMSVLCPRQSRSISVTECLACSDCGGIKVDPQENELWARCAHPSAKEAERAHQAESALSTELTFVMTRIVICVSPELPVEELAQLFLDRNINGAPVVDADGRPVGMVSKTDLVRALWGRQAPDGTEWDPWLGPEGVSLPPTPILPGLLLAEPLASAPVRTLMMPVAFTLQETATAQQAAALMTSEGVHRVPVVSSSGAVVGIVSAMDILRLVAAGRAPSDGDRRQPL